MDFTKTIDIRGKDVEITVDIYDKSVSFKADVGGKTYHSDTLEGLKTRLMAATKAQSLPLNVEFDHLTTMATYVDGKRTVRPVWQHGVLTKVHSGNKNPIIQRGSNKPEQETNWPNNNYNEPTYFKPLNQEQKDAIMAAHIALDKAQEHLKTVTKGLEINLRDAARERERELQDAAEKEVKQEAAA